MTALSAEQVLTLWERGQGRTPSARALDALRVMYAARPEDAGADPGGPRPEDDGADPGGLRPEDDGDDPGGLRPEDDGDDPGRLPVCRRDAAVLGLLAETFGPILDAVTTCPTCGEELELAVPAGLLAAAQGGDGPVEVRAGGFVVHCHAPTAGDLAAISADMPPEAAADWLFGRCVDLATRDGQDVLAADLPEAVRSAVETALESSGDGAETTLAMSCEVCGSAWRQVLDPAPFLCAEVDRAAVRLARTVHGLAAAYGWSEHDILGLSPQRRRLYLEVAAS